MTPRSGSESQAPRMAKLSTCFVFISVTFTRVPMLTDAVNIGTRVKVTEMNTKHVESFAILGAWDSDPERGVISYLSPVAQSLLNRNVGEQVEFELDGAKKHFRIESIEGFKTAEPKQPGDPREQPTDESAGEIHSGNPGSLDQHAGAGN